MGMHYLYFQNHYLHFQKHYLLFLQTLRADNHKILANRHLYTTRTSGCRHKKNAGTPTRRPATVRTEQPAAQRWRGGTAGPVTRPPKSFSGRLPVSSAGPRRQLPWRGRMLQHTERSRSGLPTTGRHCKDNTQARQMQMRLLKKAKRRPTKKRAPVWPPRRRCLPLQLPRPEPAAPAAFRRTLP